MVLQTGASKIVKINGKKRMEIQENTGELFLFFGAGSGWSLPSSRVCDRKHPMKAKCRNRMTGPAPAFRGEKRKERGEMRVPCAGLANRQRRNKK